MDEIACPDRVGSGDITCVDCCGMLSVDVHGDVELCPIGHDTFPDMDQWLMEIYSAFPDRLPDDAMVMDALANPLFRIVEAAGGPRAYLIDRFGITIGPTVIRTDPYPTTINRRWDGRP